MHTSNAIEVTGLNKTYAGYGKGRKQTPEKQALIDLDLAIPTGSIFGLLGPNGAGKSTFINILAGLVLKTSGTVQIGGIDQDTNPRQSRAAIGVVPQELNFDAFFTPFQALEVQAGLYAVPKSERRSMEILDRVGLADKAHDYPRTLSGGMRRRLLIAKAMVHSPPVLVLDEPTAGVDIEVRHMLWSYVRELNAAGVTVILTTHYLNEAEDMCDRIGIIDQGRLVACDRTAVLIGQLDAKTLLIRFGSPLPASNKVEAALDFGGQKKDKAKIEFSLREPDLLALTYLRSQTSAPELIAKAQNLKLPIIDVSTEEPDLEEVFLRFTRSK